MLYDKTDKEYISLGTALLKKESLQESHPKNIQTQDLYPKFF